MKVEDRQEKKCVCGGGRDGGDGGARLAGEDLATKEHNF